MTNMSIQPLWLTNFVEILLVPKFQLTKFIIGAFSYKAHFRPQISSDAFYGPRYPKNKKYLKKRGDDVIITNFQVFLVFGIAGSIKSMECGYSLDGELNSASNKTFSLEI